MCRGSVLAQIFPIATPFSPNVFIADHQWHVIFQDPFGGSLFSKQQLKSSREYINKFVVG